MHAARVDRSRRLGRTLAILRAHPAGLTTAELQGWTGSVAIHSDCAELRANGYDVECAYQGTTAEGRRVYRYRLVEAGGAEGVA